MAKFNAADARGEVAAALAMATLLSECEFFAEISERSVGAEALEKIILGPHAPAWDGEGYNHDELADLFCEAHLFPTHQNSKTGVVDDGSFTAPIESWSWNLVIRRYAREQELEVAHKNDIYMWFWSTLCKLEFEIMEKMEARESPKLLAIDRTVGPAFSQIGEKAAQGEYLFAEYVIQGGEQRG